VNNLRNCFESGEAQLPVLAFPGPQLFADLSGIPPALPVSLNCR